MPRRRPQTEDLNSQRWVISYADFITLLFAFFVVMYAISSVNEEKYRQVADSLSGVFAGETGEGEQPVDGDQLTDPQGITQYTGGQRQDHKTVVAIVPPRPENTAELLAIGEQFDVQFKKLIRDGHMAVQSNDLWVALEMGSNLLYPEGGDLPTVLADPIFQRIAVILKETNNPILVEGYTDNQLISTDRYPSNWELSAARAAGIVRILQLNGINPSRMTAAGYGEYAPRGDNGSELGRRANRRVVIVVTRDRRTQRVVAAFGSEQVSEDAVSGILTETDLPPSDIERVQQSDGRIVFRRKPQPDELDVRTLTSPSLTDEPATQESAE